MSRAMRWSCETEALRDTPLGSPPSNARERRKVVRLESACAKALPAGSTAAHTTAEMSIRREPCTLSLIGTRGHGLSQRYDSSMQVVERVCQPAQAPVLTGRLALLRASRTTESG